MYACPHCGSTVLQLTRAHTLWETVTVTDVTMEGDYTEVDAGSFGASISHGEWEEARCDTCDTALPLTDVFPTVAQPVAPPPDPRRVYVLLYTHKHGVDVSVYPTEDAAWDAAEAIKAEDPDDFDDDDPRAFLDVETCFINA